MQVLSLVYILLNKRNQIQLSLTIWILSSCCGHLVVSRLHFGSQLSVLPQLFVFATNMMKLDSMVMPDWPERKLLAFISLMSTAWLPSHIWSQVILEYIQQHIAVNGCILSFSGCAFWVAANTSQLLLLWKMCTGGQRTIVFWLSVHHLH